MVNSKKLLSLFLAVVMIFSVLSVMAFAADEVADGINYKYTVEKVDAVPEMGDSLEYVADNLYAVSIWMKASIGVDVITAPVHYNKAHFAPVMLYDGDMVYPGVDQDTNYTDAGGDAAFYVYGEGDYLNNTGMYKADGSTATSKRNAVCIGLGNSNTAGVTITAELVSADHPLHSKWAAGLSADTGVVYVNLDVATAEKTAYFNTVSGHTYSTDWNKMFTFYFETLPGVTEADIVGDEFGAYTDDCFGLDGNVDASGNGYYVKDGYKASSPAAVVAVENAVIEAAKNPIYHVKNQIQWADKDAGTVNLGVVAGFDVADIAMEFGADNKSTTVDYVGAIVEINGVTSDPKFEGYVYSANDGKSYYFRAVINNIPANYNGTDIVVTPLVWVNGETEPRYGEAVTITAADVARYVGKLPA